MSIAPLAVVPVLVGPLQILLAMLPALTVAVVGLLLRMLMPSAIKAGLKLLWRQKVGVLVFAGVVTGLVYGANAVLSGRGPKAKVAESGKDWPMFRGGPERRGGAAPGPTDGAVNWACNSDFKTFYSTPAVVGNRVYVSAADKGPMTDRGAILCLDADTGAVVWKAAPGNYRATFSSPSISGKYLVCGEGLHYTHDGRVVCLDISQGGKVLWDYRTKSHVECSPCIDGDRAYIGSGKDGYYCFALEPNAAGEPIILWHALTAQYPDAESPPVAGRGRVFLCLGRGGQGICCVRREDGKELWRVATPYPVSAPPTLVGDSLVVGMGVGDFVKTADEIRAEKVLALRKQGKSQAEVDAEAKRWATGGAVWCLNEQTGQIRWTFPLGDTVLGAVAAGDDRLYFASRTGFVYCISTAGKEIAKWNAHASMVTSPALADGHLYVVTETGKLYGLDADDLQPFWDATVGLGGMFISSPSVARGHVYVGSEHDGLLCIGAPGKAARPIWAGPLAGPGRGGNIDRQPLPERGTFAWYFPPSSSDDAPPALGVTAPPACVDQRLFVPLHGDRNGLICMQNAPKGTKHGKAKEAWFAAAPHGVWSSPAANDETVFFVDGQKGDANRRLHCLAIADGAERWTLPVDSAVAGTFALLDDGLLLGDRPGELAFVDAAGTVAWRSALAGQDQGSPAALYGEPVWCDSMVVAAVDNPPALTALDRQSGKVLWRQSLPAAPTAAPIMRQNTVYLGTTHGVAAFPVVGGAATWTSRTGRPASGLVIAQHYVAYVSADAELVVLDAESGQVQLHLPGATAGVTPLVARDTLVYAGLSKTGKPALFACSLASGEPRVWLTTDWLGALSASPVLANSHLYFATAAKGLVCAKGKTSP